MISPPRLPTLLALLIGLDRRIRKSAVPGTASRIIGPGSRTQDLSVSRRGGGVGVPPSTTTLLRQWADSPFIILHNTKVVYISAEWCGRDCMVLAVTAGWVAAMSRKAKHAMSLGCLRTSDSSMSLGRLRASDSSMSTTPPQPAYVYVHPH